MNVPLHFFSRKLIFIFVSFKFIFASASGGGSCSLQPISWDCDATLPSLTLKFQQVSVSNCGFSDVKDKFKDIPLVTATNTQQGQTYTLVLVDPDAPGHTNGQAWLHWIVEGIPGEDLLKGQLNKGVIKMEYAPPTPPRRTGTHRYIAFLFEEQGQNTNQVSVTTRGKFHLQTYAEGRGLCSPIATTQFATQY